MDLRFGIEQRILASALRAAFCPVEAGMLIPDEERVCTDCFNFKCIDICTKMPLLEQEFTDDFPEPGASEVCGHDRDQ